jgi:hypothetical protein
MPDRDRDRAYQQREGKGANSRGGTHGPSPLRRSRSAPMRSPLASADSNRNARALTSSIKTSFRPEHRILVSRVPLGIASSGDVDFPVALTCLGDVPHRLAVWFLGNPFVPVGPACVDDPIKADPH